MNLTTISYRAASGGTITLRTETGQVVTTGVENGEVFWDDLYLDSAHNIIVDVADPFDTKASTQHIAGSQVLSFYIEKQGPTARFDLRITNLAAEQWYAVTINGTRRHCDQGVTDDYTDLTGTLELTGILL